MAFSHAPLSVQELTDLALKYEYNPYIPLKSWLRTANSMQREAQVYAAEGNDQQTYLLLYRHADLLIDRLQKHPQRHDPDNKKALSEATATVGTDIQLMEEIRPRIKQRHAEWQARKKAQEKIMQSLEGKSMRLVPQELDGQPHQRRQEKQWLDAVGNQSLAAKLAQREVRRRDVSRRSVRQAGVSEEEETERRTGGVWGDWERELKHQSAEVDDDLSAQLQEVVRIQESGSRAPNFSRPHPLTTSTYQYPAVPHHGQKDRWNDRHSHHQSRYDAPAPPPKELLPPTYDASASPPALPPKPPHDLTPRLRSELPQPAPPPLPGKYADTVPYGPPLPGKIPPAAPTTDLDEFTFKPSAYLENGTPLRTLFLPTPLRKHFLAAASHNTQLNLETCGILCGILKNNALFITRLVIPAQTSTSDTCEMTDAGEVELFDYCDKEELMVLGWIHTHPSQTCFMSSRDLHTQVGYQVMMAESVAIVCAPSKSPDWGCFRLTDPPGKQEILNCKKPGIFHPHEVENVYTGALKPGHVVELDQGPLEVVDMRGK